MIDNAKWRETHFRFYWQVLKPLPADTAITMQVLNPSGDVVDDSALRPLPALLWYPPARWQPGETIVTESLPAYLPQAWAPVLAVSAGGQPWTPQVRASVDEASQPAVSADGRLRLPAWERRDSGLARYERPFEPIEQVAARFGSDVWQVRLAGWSAPLAVAPGGALAVNLRWQADAAAPQDYNVFVHLRDETGHTVARGDAPPTWFVPMPTSRWAGSTDGSWTAHAPCRARGAGTGPV